MKFMINRILIIVFSVVLIQPVAASEERQSSGERMTVYKNPSCGCCGKWVDHVFEGSGFQVETIASTSLKKLKADLRIGNQYQSCHTGVVEVDSEKYVFEGHVPVQYIEQFLVNPPSGAIGLSVPGMPMGSPGMEVGDREDYYQVLLLKDDGSHEVYADVNQQ